VASWSRARAYQVTTCAVPIGGAAASDASVGSLSHPDAYPIAFVTLRRLSAPRNRLLPSITAAFVKYLSGPQAAASFRQRGMLLVREEWPTVHDPSTASPPPPDVPSVPDPPPAEAPVQPPA
jgi:hypothetical protein